MDRRAPAGQKTSSPLPLVALIAGACAIGFAPIFIKTSEVGPVTTAFWRLALSLPLLWAWHAVDARRRREAAATEHTPRTVLLLLVPGLFFAGDLGLWHWAVVKTSAANATLFVNFAPLLVALACWRWLGERFRWFFFLGMAVALGGAACLLGESLRVSRESLAGDSRALMAAAFYAGYLFSVKCLRARHSTASIMAWSSLSCTVLLFPIAYFSEPGLFPLTAGGWLKVAGLAVVCHVGGQGLIAYALAQLSGSFSSVTLLLHPVAAAVLAWVILGETLGPIQGLGGVLVLTGILLAGQATLGKSDRGCLEPQE